MEFDGQVLVTEDEQLDLGREIKTDIPVYLGILVPAR